MELTRHQHQSSFLCPALASGRRLIFLACMTGMGLNVAHAEKAEGIATDRTRVVFTAGQTQADIDLMNNTGRRYLVQAWVRGLDGRTGEILPDPAPFFVKSPLKVAERHGRYHFQIMQTRPVTETRAESLYLVSFKLIPQEETGKVASDAQVVLTYNVKLFYRPDILKGADREAAVRQPGFRRQGNTLRVSNPSPYWVTLASLDAGGQNVPETELKKMLPPFGQQTYTFPHPLNTGPVRWKSIDDNGEALHTEQAGTCETQTFSTGSTALCQS